MSDTCKSCGNNLYGNKVKCPFCGEPIRNTGYSSTGRTINNNNNIYNTSNNSQSNYNNNMSSNRTVTPSHHADSGGSGWGLLGFCVPLVGIILYFVWKDERPYTAKACLNGALISIGISVFLNVIAGCMSFM